MPVYKTPDNLVELLNGVVRSASQTAFYGPRLSGATGITTLEEFRAIPPTPLSVFRDRALRDTIAEPSNVDWIVGADGGQSPARAAMVENADEGAIRYDVLADAVKEQSTSTPRPSASPSRPRSAGTSPPRSPRF